jgi:PilZ domain
MLREFISRTFTGNPVSNLVGAMSASANSTETDAAKDSDVDRRSQPRHRTIFRAARLSSSIHDVEGLAIVRNISEGGVLVESRLGFENGEHVAISLADGDRIEGEVVWQDGNSFGIRFFSWISVEQMLARTVDGPRKYRPRSPRIVIDLPIVIRTGTYLVDAHICDISQRGAKLQFDKYLPIDTRVQISRKVLRPVTGSVKWQASDLVGIEFHRTLSIDEFALWTSP